jgi:hypothetical protein
MTACTSSKTASNNVVVAECVNSNIKPSRPDDTMMVDNSLDMSSLLTDKQINSGLSKSEVTRLVTTLSYELKQEKTRTLYFRKYISNLQSTGVIEK